VKKTGAIALTLPVLTTDRPAAYEIVLNFKVIIIPDEIFEFHRHLTNAQCYYVELINAF